LFVVALGTLGWFGLQQLETGEEYVVLDQGEELPEPEPEPEPVATPEPEPEPVNQLTADEQKLVADLQGLIEEVVVMKEGSSGTRVGVVQRFLNLYLDRSDRVDNAYGSGTAARVRDFQKDQGITADGQTGPNTYRKMIEVIES